MNCPVCTLPMRETSDRGVQIDVCANQHRFFDAHELAQLGPEGRDLEERLVHTAAAGLPLPNARACPRCSGAMVRTESGDRRAEVCTQCGGAVLWIHSLSNAEVAALAGGASSGHSPLGGLQALDGLELAVDGLEIASDLGGLGVGAAELTGSALSGITDSSLEAGDLVLGAMDLTANTVAGIFSFLTGWLD